MTGRRGLAEKLLAATGRQRPPRRVAMVTAHYAPSVGGVETHVHEVSTRMAALGHDVEVLTTRPSPELPELDADGPVAVRRFGSLSRADLHLSPPLLRRLAEGGYDLVHVQGVHTLLAPLAVRAARRAGIPVVVTLHTGGHSSPLRRAVRPLQWRALAPTLRRADAVVAVCRFEQERFERFLGPRGPVPIRLVPNGAEPLPVDGGVSWSGRPLVCSVGRLERYKGHDRLIAALPALRRLRPEVRVVIAGSGPDVDRLRRLTDRLGVADVVTFRAFGPSERVGLGGLVWSADVVTLLSDYEAHPVAVMEALSLGRRVVVADGSGLRELGSYDLVTVVDRDAPPADLADRIAAAADLGAGPAPALPTWDKCVESLPALSEELHREPSRLPTDGAEH